MNSNVSVYDIFTWSITLAAALAPVILQPKKKIKELRDVARPLATFLLTATAFTSSLFLGGLLGYWIGEASGYSIIWPSISFLLFLTVLSALGFNFKNVNSLSPWKLPISVPLICFSFVLLGASVHMMNMRYDSVRVTIRGLGKPSSYSFQKEEGKLGELKWLEDHQLSDLQSYRNIRSGKSETIHAIFPFDVYDKFRGIKLNGKIQKDGVRIERWERLFRSFGIEKKFQYVNDQGSKGK